MLGCGEGCVLEKEPKNSKDTALNSELSQITLQVHCVMVGPSADCTSGHEITSRLKTSLPVKSNRLSF